MRPTFDDLRRAAGAAIRVKELRDRVDRAEPAQAGIRAALDAHHTRMRVGDVRRKYTPRPTDTAVQFVFQFDDEQRELAARLCDISETILVDLMAIDAMDVDRAEPATIEEVRAWDLDALCDALSGVVADRVSIGNAACLELGLRAWATDGEDAACEALATSDDVLKNGDDDDDGEDGPIAVRSRAERARMDARAELLRRSKAPDFQARIDKLTAEVDAHVNAVLSSSARGPSVH